MPHLKEHICPNCFLFPYRGGQCQRCGYTATEVNSSALNAGTILNNRYILGRLLGVGGFGVTYLALDTATNRVQAIKEYFPATMADRNPTGQMVFNGISDKRVFDHGLLSFRRESEYLGRFKGEPLIVQVIDSFEENNTSYLVMEYLDGVNLKALIRNTGGKIPFDFAFDILMSMIDALEKIHREGLIHRDISPENIFLTKSGRKKLIDFGAMRDFKNDRDNDGTILLKPGFAPIEQYSSKGHQGPWTDIYALAASFYYVTTGMKVPEAKIRQSGQDSILPLASVIPETGSAISAAIDKALALNYADRHQSMNEFRIALGRKPLVKPAPITADTDTTVGYAANVDAVINQMSGVPYIKIERDKGQGEKWSVPQNTDIKVGRASGLNNVVILDKRISREHCTIRYDNKNGFFILHDVSTNGTFTDQGSRYQKGKSIILAPNSRFFLAKDNIMMKVGLE